MASTINADNGVSSGSAGLKSTADSSGVLSLQTNGTTAVTINTSQNVGIGTTSPGAFGALSVNGNVIVPNTAGLVFNTSFGNAPTTLISGSQSEDRLSFFTNTTERMRVDTSGNVGIGTSSPAYKLSVNGVGNFYSGVSGLGRIWLGDPADPSGYIGIYRSTLGPSNGTTAGNGLNFASIDGYTFSTGLVYTAQTERMRIDSSGNLLVGTTTAGGRLTALASGSGTAGYFASSGSVAAIAVVDSGANGANVALYGNGATTPNKYLRAQSGGFEVVNSGYSATIMRVADAGVYSTAVGATNRVMYVDNSNVIGYLSSVRASKTNIAPMPATDWLLQLQPKTFNYRKKNADGKYTDEADGGIQYGLIAEEVEQVKPDLCFYDEVDGKQELRGIHYEKLVVPMLRAIQELKAEVDSLKSQLAAKG